MHKVWLFNLRTGALIRRVFPSKMPWETSLLGDGEGTATFKTDDADRPLSNVPRTFQPNARGLAVIWGDVVEYAGKIENWWYDRDAQVVTVKTVEIRVETFWRMTYGVNVYESGTLSISNRSASGAVRAIVDRMLQWSPAWDLPIDLPPDGGGPITEEWEHWRKLRISDLLQQIEEEGYEVYFRPYRAGQQAIRFETIVAPKIATGMTKFHLQAAEIPIDKIEFGVDGANQVTGVQGLGDGMEQDQKVAWAGVEDPDIIIRDTKKIYPDLVGTRLQSATDAGLEEDRAPTTQWSIGRFQASDDWPPVHALPGRRWSIHTKGDPVIPDGTYGMRVIATRGDITNQEIAVEVQNAA